MKKITLLWVLLAVSPLVWTSTANAPLRQTPTGTNARKKAAGNISGVNAKATPSPTPKPTPTPTPNVELVRVKISTSRPEVAVNGGYGVFAELENVGSKPVALFSDEVELVVQPEVTVSTNCVYRMSAFFPTELYPPGPEGTPTPVDKKSSTPTPSPKPDASPVETPTPSLSPSPTPTPAQDERGAKIVLQPAERYSVFWGVSTLTTVDPTCPSKNSYSLTKATFVPGEYIFTVDGKAYPVSDKGEVDNTYHTFTDRTVLRVSIPQTWAMLSAFVGAIVAYFVTTLRKGYHFGIMIQTTRGAKARAFFVVVRDLFSAGLMGAVVTILTSRLSETQFPIKVSVNDIWGAATIGFLAYFVGYKLIDKLVGSVPDDAKRKAVAPQT